MGAISSLNVINCVQLLLLPQLSSAVQVRLIARRPVQLAVPSVSTKVTDLMPLHASLAVAVPVLFVVAGIVQTRLMFAGQEMTGATLSLKSIICVQVLLLPQLSSAVQVRVITPRSEEHTSELQSRLHL